MAGCSSAWFIERYLRPGEIDQAIDPRMRGSIAHVALQRFYSQLPSEIPGAERVTTDNLEAAVDAHAPLRRQRARLGPPDRRRRPPAARARSGPPPRSRAAGAGRCGCKLQFVPRKLEVAFKSYELAPGVAVSGKIDRVDADPLSARGIVVDYKSGAAPSATQIHDEARLQIPLYLLVLRDQLGLEPMGGVYMPLGGARRARGLLRAGADQVPGFAARRLSRGSEPSRPRSTTRARRRSSSPGASERATSCTILVAATARRGAISGACAARSEREHHCFAPSALPNEQQAAAIEARGSTFVSAGAGTGKTTVLVERFARAVVQDGLDVDSLLVITYTDRAAGELRGRIRARLVELERPDLARDLDGAWISTIHGFCRRLLTAYPLAAGIDPRFRVLDEAQARVLQGEAFTAALEAFCAVDEPDRWQLPVDIPRRGPAIDARERLRHPALGGPRARSSSRVCARASRRGSRSSSPRRAR